jgi:two-component system sensor histidine kinase/response regulator
MDENAPFILNVDDYNPSRYARTKVLQQAGFNVTEAATGRDTLRIVADQNPLLVLLDVNLPDMTGFEVCHQIKTDPKTKGTTVVHISASSIQTHHQVYGLDTGAEGYLVEPIEPGLLIATVKAFIRARKAEDALRRSNDELEWFAYRVAHDLSEPLRTVTAHTQLLEEALTGKLDEKTFPHFHFVIDGAQRMKSFIDDFLRYAQVTHVDRERAALDCGALLEQVVSNLAAAIESCGARVTHDALPVVVADPALEYVFQNLISNAIKYRREDAPPEIHVSARAESVGWLFSVRDNGMGIEAQHRETIFDIFRRLNNRDIPGSGIGLALSRKIVKAGGGTIWVESEPGAGSTFYFTLPKHAPRA